MVAANALNMRRVKKYIQFISIGFSEMVAWRFGFLMIAIGAVIGWLVMIAFWRAVYAGGNQIGSFTLAQLILYYTVNSIFIIILDYSFVWDVSTDVHEGRLSEYLVKPISYVSSRFMRECGARAATLLAAVTPLIGVIFYFREMLPSSYTAWLFCLMTLFLGFIATALFGFTLSLASVFLQNQHTAPSIFFAISFLLAGRLIPLDVMPHWLATIARATPFPFLASVPIEFILGTRTALNGTEITLLLGWLIILGIVTSFMWKFSAIRYEASGN